VARPLLVGVVGRQQRGHARVGHPAQVDAFDAEAVVAQPTVARHAGVLVEQVR
jgi:hypothetical protein